MSSPDPVLLANLGPLAALAGTWEGAEGVDVAFEHAIGGAEETRFRERSSYEPFGPIVNGKQTLFGLDYRTVAWPIGEDEPFHTEVGYWLWDAAAARVMRCFMVPRGAVVLAGGEAAADALQFSMRAEQGAPAEGILSNRYLHENARTLRYELTVRIEGDACFHYEEDTVLAMGGRGEPFHHTDRNTLKRLKP